MCGCFAGASCGTAIGGAHVAHGVSNDGGARDNEMLRVKMDDSGNILIKRIAKANVYVKSGDGENAVANEILKVGPFKVK